MRTKVVNVRHGVKDAVYIGRAGHGHSGIFGNPVVVGRTCRFCSQPHLTGGSTLKCYKDYLLARIEKDPAFKSQLEGLRGKTLACFCVKQEWVSPGDASPLCCHGQVIALYLDGWK